MRLSLSHWRFSFRLILALVLVGAWSRSAVEEPTEAPPAVAEGPRADRAALDRGGGRPRGRAVRRSAAAQRTRGRAAPVSVYAALGRRAACELRGDLSKTARRAPREAEITLQGGGVGSRELRAAAARAARGAKPPCRAAAPPFPRIPWHSRHAAGGGVSAPECTISARLQSAPLDPAAHEQAALCSAPSRCGKMPATFRRRPPRVQSAYRASRPRRRAARGRERELRGGPGGAPARGVDRRGAAAVRRRDQGAHRARRSANPALRPWLLAAKLRNRNDWRLADGRMPETLLERFEFFRALCEAAGPEIACATLARSPFRRPARLAAHAPAVALRGGGRPPVCLLCALL